MRGRRLKAIRGAVCARANTSGAIESAAQELVGAIERENAITPEEVVSALFTVTPDLDAQFPAAGARRAGWASVPLLCAREIPVPGDLPRCIRVLVHAYLPVGREPRHVYLGEAARLRPDWTDLQASNGQAGASSTPTERESS